MNYALERLLAKAEKDEITGCWNWVAALSRLGYGHFRLNGKIVEAHRASWMLHRGDPHKLHVLHKCNNRRCINPDHLYLGTHQDNMRDRSERFPVWAVRHTLNAEDIPVIRQRFSDGEKLKVIAMTYGVVEETIRSVVTGRSWRSVS